MLPNAPANVSTLPHAPGRLPVLGDVTSVDRRRPTQKEASLAKTLGPIFQRLLLGDRLIIVAGAELAAQCDDEANWARALAGPGVKLRTIGGSGLFTARSSDPLWGQARRILDPGFTQAALRAYHRAMSSVADDLIDSWTVAGDRPVDVHKAMTSATLEVISRAGFSKSMGLFSGTDQAGERFVSTLGRVLQWASESTNDVPVLGAIRARVQRRQLNKDIAFAQGYVDSVVAERRGEQPGVTSGDLLSLMLDVIDPDTGVGLPDDNVRDQVLTFLVAGHETTAALLEVALFYLAAHPEYADRVRGEACARGGFDYDDVSGMRWTRQFLNECLRLWPPVPGYFRVARKDQSLGGYAIPAGRGVFVLSLAAQRDTNGWGSAAEAFDPGRFSPENLRNHPDRFFGPWGTGPRSCIGRAFAFQESILMVSKIVSAFDLRLDGDAGELEMRERGTLRPAPFQIRVSQRTEAKV